MDQALEQRVICHLTGRTTSPLEPTIISVLLHSFKFNSVIFYYSKTFKVMTMGLAAPVAKF